MSRFAEVDGENLRKLRQGMALSQQDLERLTGVAQHTISALESGKRGARPSTIRRLSEALGVETVALVRSRDEHGA